MTLAEMSREFAHVAFLKNVTGLTLTSVDDVIVAGVKVATNFNFGGKVKHPELSGSTSRTFAAFRSVLTPFEDER